MTATNTLGDTYARCLGSGQDRPQTSAVDRPEHPDHPRILAVSNEATRPLRARGVCEALGHEQRPKDIEGTRARLKRLVKLDVRTEADAGNFTSNP